jgi:hypothetical protein
VKDVKKIEDRWLMKLSEGNWLMKYMGLMASSETFRATHQGFSK